MIEKEICDESQPITIITFLTEFRMVCNNADVHEGDAVWLLTYFLRSKRKCAYQARLSSPEDVRRNRLTTDQKITSYLESVDYLLSTYTTADVINEADSSVHRLRQHRFSVQEYVDELVDRAVKCGDVFDDNELMKIFVEGLTDKIRLNVQHYWSAHQSIRILALNIYDVSINATHATHKRELGTRRQKNKDPLSSA